MFTPCHYVVLSIYFKCHELEWSMGLRFFCRLFFAPVLKLSIKMHKIEIGGMTLELPLIFWEIPVLLIILSEKYNKRSRYGSTCSKHDQLKGINGDWTYEVRNHSFYMFIEAGVILLSNLYLLLTLQRHNNTVFGLRVILSLAGIRYMPGLKSWSFDVPSKPLPTAPHGAPNQR